MPSPRLQTSGQGLVPEALRLEGEAKIGNQSLWTAVGTPDDLAKAYGQDLQCVMPVDELELTKPPDGVALSLNIGRDSPRGASEIGEEPRGINVPRRLVYVAVGCELPFEALPGCMSLIDHTKSTEVRRDTPHMHVNGRRTGGRKKSLNSCSFRANRQQLSQGHGVQHEGLQEPFVIVIHVGAARERIRSEEHTEVSVCNGADMSSERWGKGSHALLQIPNPFGDHDGLRAEPYPRAPEPLVVRPFDHQEGSAPSPGTDHHHLGDKSACRLR